MADDFQVKQSSSNSGAYGLTGGVIGAAAGGLGSHILTKPKYSSHTDIINEAKDSADFKSKLEKAEGEEKKFLQAAKDVADEKANAEKVWENEFKAYQETHKEGIKKDEKFIELEKKQAEYQAKIKELEAKTEKTVTTETKNVGTMGALRQNAKEANIARKELQDLKDKNAPKEAIDKARARFKKYDARFNSALDKVVENATYNVKGENEIAAAKKALRNDLMQHVTQYLEVVDSIEKPVKALSAQEIYQNAKKGIGEKQNLINDALKSIKEVSSRDLTDALVNNKGARKGIAFDNEVEAILKAENKKAETIKNILKNFPSGEKVIKGVTARELLKEGLKSLWYNTPMNIKETVVYDPEKAMQDFIETLRPNEKALFEGKEVTKETIEGLIKESEERAAKINEAAKAVRTSTSSIATMEKEIREVKEAIVKQYGEGTYFNENGEIYNKGAKVKIEKPKTPQIQVPEFKTDVKAELPKEIGIEVKSTKVTEAPELADVRKNLEEITKQIEEAKKGLQKGELKPEEQLAEFAKSKGVKDKEEFLNNSVKEKTEKFAKDFEAQFKRKWGFAEHTNWKIAGAAAAGAVVLGGLFSLFAPKNK